MIRTSFVADWTVRPGRTAFGGGQHLPLPVTLPHDAMRDLPRSPDSPEGAHTGYHPEAFVEYSKAFDVPEDYRDKTVRLEFEGVYRDAVVFLNGDFAGQRPNGYTGFVVQADAFLQYGQVNTVTVQARAHRDSRWYSGVGIHRPVHLVVADPVHLALDGVCITTPDVDAERAVVAVATTVENDGRATRTLRVRTRVVDAGGAVVATGSAPVTVLPGGAAVVRLRLRVVAPALWSIDAPALYTAETTLVEGDAALDEDCTPFGIRTLQLDPEHGLRVNGDVVDLRGACIHHDAGPLGAAAVPRADERRIEILKAAGFNAIRSAHNPVSRATLDACDRIGVLVMDEIADVWTHPKSPFDYSLAFPEWWERDVEAMVVKDRNHPSVVLYSIGNEIAQTGRPLGSEWGRRLAEKVRSLDDTRYVTNGINGLLSVLDVLPEQSGPDGGGDLNAMMSSLGEAMLRVSASELVTDATEESASVLDVVGFNYGDSRYVPDRERFPNRVLVGSETFPGHIAELWRLVRENSHVIGDFTWTGWDYLGEAGIGRVERPDDEGHVPGIAGPYPWLTAWCGDIDITGSRRPASHYREVVFGLRSEPYIAVHRPQFHGRPVAGTPWSWTDSVSSWSFDVPDGSPATVDVYTDAEEVELRLTGRSLGRATVGAEQPYVARFDVAYQPGELTAVAFAGDEERGRTTLRTAVGPLRLTAASDRDTVRTDDTDLAYVSVAVQDQAGTLDTDRDVRIDVEVRGPGVLAGLGSARPRTEEPFGAASCTTSDGRALAIIRPTGPGRIEVTVSADGYEPRSVVVTTAGLPVQSPTSRG